MGRTKDDAASPTTGGTGSQTLDQFDNAVLACMDDLGRSLPGLAERFDQLVVIEALAEHVGLALQALVRRQICDQTRVRLLIKRIEDIASCSKSTGSAVSDEQMSSQLSIRMCVAEISVVLPSLVDRHTCLVVICALTELLGGSIFVCHEANLCSEAQARATIRRVTHIALGESK